MKQIFVILLFFFGLLVQSQEKADLIVYNGKIATMQKSNEFVQALAIKNGIILATGTSKNILESYKATSTEIIDAKGKTVIPGLNDSHIHVIREGNA
jgi:predicted amidohydrolase YtcJ